MIHTPSLILEFTGSHQLIFLYKLSELGEALLSEASL